jgi:hypothetical protein
MEAFEPPKYLSSLIAAVNDGAKSAQGGAFLFLLVGLYLLATAFSASDEDLLLGKAVTKQRWGLLNDRRDCHVWAVQSTSQQRKLLSIDPVRA